MFRLRMLSAGALGLALVLAVPQVSAQDNAIFALKNRWEHIESQTPEDNRAKALASLASELEALVQQYPDNAEVLTWQGIVLASQARAEGGMGALSLVKQARQSLERAVEIDPDGSNGSAYVTLGILYDKVPGWPIGFGDSDTAEAMFKKALSVRPDGVDANYYFAAFLQDEGRKAEALEYARRAVAGQVREGRESSDETLREQAGALTATLG